MLLKWTKKLSSRLLCRPPEKPCIDDYMVNAAAISDDGSRAVAGTYYKPYAVLPNAVPMRERVDGRYGVYVFDTSGAGTLLFSNEFQGDEGIYTVAISGNGAIAAGAGMLNRTRATQPRRGVLRAFEVATGRRILNTSKFVDRVNSISLSRNGDILAVVAESSLYVFTRQPSGLFSTTAQFVNLAGRCDTVAVHPDGTWIAAADYKGRVYVVPIATGVVGTPSTWIAEEPDASGVLSAVKLRSVAVSRTTDALVAGGGRFVYYFTRASMTAGTPRPVARFDAFGAVQNDGVKWVAIADDGSFVTAVVNDQFAAGIRTGRLFKLSLAGAVLNKDWERNLSHPPNSTSVDSSGTRITAADGWPNHTAGAFYLFDHLGTQLAVHPTTEMNWPMQISADGTGIIAGSDDNTLFFFTA